MCEDTTHLKGYRYDGFYLVTSHWQETGRSGFKVWRFKLERMKDQKPLEIIPEDQRKELKKSIPKRPKAEIKEPKQQQPVLSKRRRRREGGPGTLPDSIRSTLEKVGYVAEYFEEYPPQLTEDVLEHGKCFICGKVIPATFELDHLTQHFETFENLITIPDTINRRNVLNQARIR